MELSHFFKGIVDADDKAIVVCDLNHTIVYMNPAAVEQYKNRGGEKLIGKCIFDCHNPHSQDVIKKNVAAMAEDKTKNKIFEFHKVKNGANDDVYTAAIRDEDGSLIGYYEKFEDKHCYSESLR